MKRAGIALLALSTIGSVPGLARAATVSGEVEKQSFNLTAVVIFFAFVLFTLGLTWRAARATRTREAFYTAGGGISPVQNGFAIAGDFMSAATLLGITGLMFFKGYDALVLSFTIILGWTLSLVLVAEKLRNLGKHTFVDVVSYRLGEGSVRILLVLCSLVVVLFYLIGQMVGAGKLIQLLFGLDYPVAIVAVSILMVVYVYFGGMKATTWVQMVKAGLLLFGGGLVSVLVLVPFGFDFSAMMDAAASRHPLGESVAAPGGWLKNDVMNVWTVGLTMTFGIMGLPHVLMRFLTVANGAAARKSVGYATVLMAVFYVFITVIGFGAIALLWDDPTYRDASGALVGGSNMVALHLSQALGGDALLGFMSAVSFATILAVVAGLTLSGAAAISHDLYAVAIKKGKGDPSVELKLSRGMTLVFGVLAVVLGLAFEKQNIAVIVATALAVAASVNFPLLVLAIYWRRLTSRGALIGGGITLALSVVLIVLSDGVWVKILGFDAPIFPYVYPTVLSMPVGFVSIMAASLLDRSAQGRTDREGFDAQLIRAETGIGADLAAQH